MPNIHRMRIQGNLLYLLDREKGFAILDRQKLLGQTESHQVKQWQVYTTAGDPVLSTDGSVWWLSANLSGELNICGMQ